MDIVLEFEGATEMLAGCAPDSDRSSGQVPLPQDATGYRKEKEGFGK